MTDKEIVERAKEAEKKTGFGELVHSPISKGVNSAYGIGFIEGMVEYRNLLQEEPVSEELEEAAFDYAEACKYDGGEKLLCVEHFKAGAKWQAENLWKPADGNDLPIFDREVIAILGNGKVVFAHRPSEHWDGKNIVTGKVTRYYPKTYGKGGWNIPNIKWWLDCSLPNMEED